MGTINNHGVMVKRSCNDAVTSAICCVSFTSFINPAIVKIINVITIDGMVVISMYRMCVKRGVLVVEAANIVVSDRGDILSPK